MSILDGKDSMNWRWMIWVERIPARAISSISPRRSDFSAFFTSIATLPGSKIPALEIANKWKERNDARAYALVGDPAASLRVEDIA